MLLVPGRDLAHGALARLGQVEEDPEAQPLAELVVEARALRSLLVGVNRLLGHRRRAAADQPLDAVLHHEVEPAGAGAHHRLPALDRLP